MPRVSRYVCLGVLGSLALHALVMGYPFWKNPRIEAALQKYFSYVPVVLSSGPDDPDGQLGSPPSEPTDEEGEFRSSFERDGFR